MAAYCLEFKTRGEQLSVFSLHSLLPQLQSDSKVQEITHLLDKKQDFLY